MAVSWKGVMYLKNLHDSRVRCRALSEGDIVNEVITLQETAEILGLHDSTVRKMVLSGKFEAWQYRKTNKVILFNKKSIIDMVESKE